MKKAFRMAAAISYALSAIFIAMGFYKMFSYSNPESIYRKHINVYVGGDAYNYIINSNYATGYFVLAVFCAVIGMTFVVSYFLSSKKLLEMDEGAEDSISI